MSEVINKIKEELTFQNVLRAAMKTPGVKINRSKFLKKELAKHVAPEVIEQAIKKNPAQAGISKSIINKVSSQVINYETAKVTSLSVAASIPGGAAAIGAAAADITSYFAFVVRIVQELAYLYGYDEFDLNDDSVDSETMNLVLLFIGVMFGVQGAATLLKKISDLYAAHVAKVLAKKALAKGIIYPIVKKVAANVGVRMTKQIFADTVASAVPVVGGLLSGGLTFAMFKPCCGKLRKNLMSSNLCDPDFYRVFSTDYVDVTESEIDTL